MFVRNAMHAMHAYSHHIRPHTSTIVMCVTVLFVICPRAPTSAHARTGNGTRSRRGGVVVGTVYVYIMKSLPKSHKKNLTC